MNLRFKYFFYIIFIHLALGVALYFLFQEKKFAFLACELGILISLSIGLYFYRQFMFPFTLLESGKNVIKEEDFTIKYVPTGNSEVDNLITVYNTMIETLRKEKTKTAEQSYFLENFIRSSPLGIIIMNFDNEFYLVNDTAKKLFDLIKPQGMKLDEIDHPLTKALQNMNSFEEQIISIEGIQKYKCKKHEIIHQGFSRQFVIIEELTKELLEAEKNAFGKVIRMMAHEVNNSMGAVNSILDSLIEDIKDNKIDEETASEYLQIVRNRNSSLGEFTDNFADVIRVPDPLKSSVKLNEFALKLTSIFQAQCAKQNITIELELAKTDIIWDCDPVLMEQAFVNIIKNSIESIENNGIIKITTTLPNSIRISDNGAGISAENAERIFQPFFSTKPTGQGVGLMLIREILQKHKAQFKLFTDKNNEWTHFDIKM